MSEFFSFLFSFAIDVDGDAFSVTFVLFSPPLQFAFESVTVTNPGSAEIQIRSDQINIGSSSGMISSAELEAILGSIVYATNRTT